jgi:hypothetical protein
MPHTIFFLAVLGGGIAADQGYPWLGGGLALVAILELWSSGDPRRQVRKLVRQILRRERDQVPDMPHEFAGMYDRWAYGKAPESELAREALGFGWMEPEQFEVVRRAIRRSVFADDSPNPK